MKNLSRWNDANSAKVATLILSSAPVLLPYLFTDEKKALNFLVNAAQREHGQYSAARHHLAYSANSNATQS
jgi:hypothetical protein